MESALVAAPVVAGLAAALFGFFVVRLSGIYLAMLTLASAQIVYAVAFQWVEVTGRRQRRGRRVAVALGVRTGRLLLSGRSSSAAASILH